MHNVLFLVHRIPYPPNKGDKIRSYHVLKFLATRYRVHLATFIDDQADQQYVSTVQQLCAGETLFLPLQPTRAKLRSLWGLMSGEALSVAYYRNARLQQWVSDLSRRHAIQRVLIFSGAMAQYADRAESVRRVMDFVDIDSDKWRQYAARRRGLAAWLYRREARYLFAYERKVATQCEANVFVSPAEAQLFRTWAPESAARVLAIANGVDLDYFSPDFQAASPYPQHSRVLVFTGAMDYWANIDAVVWFAREIFPHVRACLPTARFVIVGARPPSEVIKLQEITGVEVTGAVPDVRPYLAHATAAVAPLRIARGIQNKVLEAMAMGKPVIATPAAAEGIGAVAGEEILVASEVQAYVEAAVRVLTQEAAAMGAAARQCVERAYRWEDNLPLFGRLLEGEV